MAGKPGRPRKERPDGEESGKIWGVRDVSEEAKRSVKRYAIDHGMSVGEALNELVAVGESAISDSLALLGDSDVWAIRGVDKRIRFLVYLYARQNKMTTAEALRVLIPKALGEGELEIADLPIAILERMWQIADEVNPEPGE